MTSILDIAKFITSLEPASNPAQLAFYNYLKNYRSSTETFSTETLKGFYSHALTFQYWQNQQSYLQKEVSKALLTANKSLKLDLRPDQLDEIGAWQLVRVRKLSDLYDIAHQQLKQSYKDFRLIPDKHNLIALIISDKVIVRYLSNQCYINKGQLDFLQKDLQLVYDQNLNFDSTSLQYIQTATFQYARFTSQLSRLNGHFIRGYSMQKQMDFDSQDITEIPSLFYAIKRLESFFISKNSDPLYQNLSEQLEKALQLLQQKHPNALNFALQTLESGQNAVENIFPDDKMLILLLKELSARIYSNQAVPLTETR